MKSKDREKAKVDQDESNEKSVVKRENENNSLSSELPEQVKNFFNNKQINPDDMPPELMMALTRSIQVSGTLMNPMADKFTSEHLSKILDNDEKQNEREFQDKQRERDNENKNNFQNRILFGFVFVLIIALICFLVLYNKDALAERIAVGLVGLITGFIGGYGYSETKKFKNKQ